MIQTVLENKVMMFIIQSAARTTLFFERQRSAGKGRVEIKRAYFNFNQRLGQVNGAVLSSSCLFTMAVHQ